MSTFLDSSVLIPLGVGRHPNHAAVVAWYQQQAGMLTSAHALAETFNVWTGRYGVPPDEAARTLRQWSGVLTVVALSTADYLDALDEAARLGVSGATVYDGLHARAATLGKARTIATYNVRHYARLWPTAALVTP